MPIKRIYKLPFPDKVRYALREVLQYVAMTEYRDYQERGEDPNHIYHHATVASEWLYGLDDTVVVDEIEDLLSGREWTPDTLDEVARLVRATGRKVRSPGDQR